MSRHRRLPLLCARCAVLLLLPLPFSLSSRCSSATPLLHNFDRPGPSTQPTQTSTPTSFPGGDRFLLPTTCWQRGCRPFCFVFYPVPSSPLQLSVLSNFLQALRFLPPRLLFCSEIRCEARLQNTNVVIQSDNRTILFPLAFPPFSFSAFVLLAPRLMFHASVVHFGVVIRSHPCP